MQIEMMRHSLAHVLAQAVTELFEGTQLAIGPAIDHGFYYDFDLPHTLTDADFAAIEARMTEILKRRANFTRCVATKEKALETFANNPYKTELISELPGDEEISLYYTGDEFCDLCRGPHADNTQQLLGWAFKLHAVTGAYWRGDASRKMLQRVYVYAFPNKAELKAHLHMLEEAKKRDHRKIGREQELFALMDEGPGLPFYLPKGMILRNQLLAFWRQLHTEAGYEEINTPIMLNQQLWERSGHWFHYKENMYTTQVEEQEFAIKPMSCPGALLYYGMRPRSYRELPMRLAELGLVHRNELSGALHGLMRVRGFTQDDTHIFMTREQIKDEVKANVALIQKIYGYFGFDCRIELSTRPEKAMGDIADWDAATDALREAITELGYDYQLNEGDGAFYGPKLDFHLSDCLGRSWQCGTLQLDFQLPERFELEYVGSDGQTHRPTMIHRATLGSIERFIGIITEHFAGKFPLWLSPLQIGVVPVRDEHNAYAEQVAQQLRAAGLRVQVDTSEGNMGSKIKTFRQGLTPYIVIVGDAERDSGTISLRVRTGTQVNDISLSHFTAMCKQAVNSRQTELQENFAE
ncbi:MAG: threonine--tRNA ligase [Oscillospiraceae bacterium]|nr:threonine--tRNA ligase [Oscillospiraceae bacterium]